MFSYTVRCRFSNPSIASRWLQWLTTEHLDDVIAAGALGAEIFEMTSENPEYEIRYQFASQEAFETYDREKAPALREEGLTKFPLSLGLEYERTTGKRLLQR